MNCCEIRLKKRQFKELCILITPEAHVCFDFPLILEDWNKGHVSPSDILWWLISHLCGKPCNFPHWCGDRCTPGINAGQSDNDNCSCDPVRKWAVITGHNFLTRYSKDAPSLEMSWLMLKIKMWEWSITRRVMAFLLFICCRKGCSAFPAQKMKGSEPEDSIWKEALFYLIQSVL